ncbi:MAG: hypothetical protein ACTSR8_21080 [Promethearchaeota archaeon]
MAFLISEAVTLFLLSALDNLIASFVASVEAIMSDLFFRYSGIWFQKEINNFYNFKDDLFKKYGRIIANNENIKYSEEKFIDGNHWVIPLHKRTFCKRWASMEVREHVFKSCKKLNILKDYQEQLFANNLKEIEHFEILKKILEEKTEKSLNIINFQALFNNKGVVQTFNNFFGIDFAEIKPETQEFDEIIKKRHGIIHGTINDVDVEENEVINALNILKRIKSYVSDLLGRLDFHNSYRLRSYDF